MEAKSTDLRLVAVFEAGKGLLVFATACALFKFIHADAQEVAEQLVRHFHLNPASHYPRVFLEFAANLSDTSLLALSLGALAYAAVRFIEAYGLWFGRRWAWMLGMASAGLYIPVELFELVERVNWAGMAVFLANVLVLLVLWRGRAR